MRRAGLLAPGVVRRAFGEDGIGARVFEKSVNQLRLATVSDRVYRQRVLERLPARPTVLQREGVLDVTEATAAFCGSMLSFDWRSFAHCAAVLPHVQLLPKYWVTPVPR
jgi:hypothetical protein